jgi:hypothetical protein
MSTTRAETAEGRSRARPQAKKKATMPESTLSQAVRIACRGVTSVGSLRALCPDHRTRPKMAAHVAPFLRRRHPWAMDDASTHCSMRHAAASRCCASHHLQPLSRRGVASGRAADKSTPLVVPLNRDDRDCHRAAHAVTKALAAVDTVGIESPSAIAWLWRRESFQAGRRP